jgi:hypothetical protein
MRYEEEQIQMAVVRWVRATYDGIRMTCTPANAKDVRQGVRNKKMGLQKSWPDLFFAEPRGGYHGLFIEIKTLHGDLPDDQKEMLQSLNDRGYRAHVCYGQEDVIKSVTAYMKLPGYPSF